MRAKVSVIGAGNVGATTAQLIAREALADVVLYDVVEGVPQGKALDILEACPLWGSSVSVNGANDFDATGDSDIIVVTAGFPRKPGMSRDDLLQANAGVIKKVVRDTASLSPQAIFIVVTNPMDVMAQIAWKISGFSQKKVIGMGGVLDSARFRTFVSMELGVSPSDVEALVMGGHGDQMVPLRSFTTVKGISLDRLISPDRLDALINRTRQGGAEIVSHLKTGSAYYAPAAATVEMVRSIVKDEKRVLPCSCLLKGEYGVNDVYVGVPAILGKEGIEKILQLELSPEEEDQFRKSVSAVSAMLEISFRDLSSS